MIKIFLALILCSSLFANDDSETVFTSIYKNRNWGENEKGKGFSGYGSTLSNTKVYSAFLQDFIKLNNIKTVVDAGCGDWTFSKEIDWSEVEYFGFDVVKSVIEENIEKHASTNIHFQCVDILRYALPPADLLICKDVLMHLSNRDIIFFLKSIKQYKHCLFTNNLGWENENSDIPRGEFRPLDLTKPPFFLNGIKIFTYSTDHSQKQILYHGN